MIRVQSAESVGCSSERLARIRSVMQSYVDRRNFAGITTLLARRGRVIHFDQVGYQDRESQTPLSPDTIYRIYSMTKPIVCTALMTLYEEGRFQLLDPVAKFLPAFGKANLVRPMLIRDLFTHTSGLTYDFVEDNPVAGLYRQARIMGNPNRSLEAAVGELARLPLAYQPGERWHYSVSIDVLAHLIEVISGKPLRQFLKERIFDPLQMKDTAFAVRPENRHRLATMYGHPDVSRNPLSVIIEAWQAGKNERRDVEETYPSKDTPAFARGGHGLFSTAGDYLRFAQMLLNRGELDGVRVLSPKIVDFMHMNHLPASLLPMSLGPIAFPGYGFGLGSRVLLNVAESMLPGSVGEFGWAGVGKTFYWVDPKEELIGILMAQYMVCFDQPEKDFQVLAYQSIIV